MKYLGGKTRIANDYNEYLIAMFAGLLSGGKLPRTYRTRIALASIKRLPRDCLFTKGNFKNRNHEKEKFKRRD